MILKVPQKKNGGLPKKNGISAMASKYVWVEEWSKRTCTYLFINWAKVIWVKIDFIFRPMQNTFQNFPLAYHDIYILFNERLYLFFTNRHPYITPVYCTFLNKGLSRKLFCIVLSTITKRMNRIRRSRTVPIFTIRTPTFSKNTYAFQKNKSIEEMGPFSQTSPSSEINSPIHCEIQ